MNASSAPWSSTPSLTALYQAGRYRTELRDTDACAIIVPSPAHAACGTAMCFWFSRSWCKKAAEQGHQLAMFNLGTFYHHGQGLDKDLAQAVRWYRAAAEAGEMRAANNLGVCYEKGHGLEQDYDQAVRWYRTVRACVGVPSVCCGRGPIRARLTSSVSDGVGDQGAEEA